MSFFKNPDVEKKYKNTNGDADPIINVAIQYRGKLSEIPMNIADKIFADGAHIAPKTEKDIEPKAEKDLIEKPKK